MQERAKIQLQLKQMREDCVKDYLESKLESIASKQVVNDILMGFLESNNQEFLESVTESILQAKENSKRLKESMEALIKDQEQQLRRERERVKEECRQEHLKEMTKLRQEIGLIKNNLQSEESEYAGRIEQVKQQLRVSAGINQQLREQLQLNQAKNSEMAIRIAQLSMDLQQRMKQAVEYNQLITQLKSQAADQRIKYETESNALKNMHAIRQKELREQLQSSNVKAIHEQRQVYQGKISSIEQKLKQQLSQRMFQQLQAKRLEYQLQKCRIIIKEENSKLQFIQLSLTKNQRLLQQKQAQMTMLQGQVSNLQQQNKSNLQKIASLQRRNAQICTNHNQTRSQLKDKINRLETQKELASLSNRYLQDKLQKQTSQHIFILQRYQKEIQELKANLAFKEQERKACQQRLEKQIEARLTSQEEVSTLLKYNAIHQLQAQRCAAELRRVEQECRAEVSTYQQTFQLNIEELEQQLALSKEENTKLKHEIVEIQRQIELQEQRERYYHGYLEEIAFLKSQLAKFQTERRKALSHKQVQQLVKRMDICYKENRKLKEIIGEQLSCFQQELNQAFNSIVNAAQQSSLMCHYCRHQREQLKMAKSPYNKRPQMDKTVPRSGMQKQSMASMKRNLKSIQQKYQIAYSQNQSFTNRIESYLNNS